MHSKKDESSGDWIKRVAEILGSAKNLTVQAAIQAMRKNCRFEPLVHKLSRAEHKIDSFDQLLATADKYAKTDRGTGGLSQNPTGKLPVAKTERRAHQMQEQGSDKALPPNKCKGIFDVPCDLHRRRDGRPASHTKAQCHYYRRWKEGDTPDAARSGSMQYKNKSSSRQRPDVLPRRNIGQFHTVEVQTTDGSRKSGQISTPERYRRWIEQSVIWSRGDHTQK